MNLEHFISKWQKATLKERSGSQEHFLDLCHLLEHPTPAEADPDGTNFTFERATKKANNQQGFADVWKREHFAWEYKGKHANLDDAYNQLLSYHDKLNNPPLLITSDMQRFEVRTKFTNSTQAVYAFDLEGLRDPKNLQVLKDAFFNPDALNPKYHREAVTQEASKAIGTLALALRDRGHDSQQVAHFLMQLVFSLFAEDVGLLPKELVTRILQATCDNPAKARRYFSELFAAMATGGDVLLEPIPHFNGGLFDTGDYDLPLLYEAELQGLLDAAKLDWVQVEPAIFGTLFERSLDPNKRSQLGAHYTSREDILRIVRPVILEPLEQDWQTIRDKVERYLTDPPKLTGKKASNDRDKHVNKPIADFLSHLHGIRVLDPACGSGNFLYVALQQLKELEKKVISFANRVGAPALSLLSPRQFYGLEKNIFAHELASIVVWIGYLQWNHLNGVSNRQTPVLEKLNNIRLQDALMDEDGNEAEWPQAEFIVGNPPFLGNYKMREELGDDYVDMLYKQYKTRLPNMADFVCYWFEKARANIEQGKTQRAGLIATNSIRGGANRKVLERVKDTGDIFMAWNDEPWILDGAAVRVSIVAFDDGSDSSKVLDGSAVKTITPSLTSGVDVSSAQRLTENANISFEGASPKGSFDVDGTTARKWLELSNPGGKDNSDVVKRYLSAKDIVHKDKDRYVVDFHGMELEEAKQYRMPMAWVREKVKPKRDTVKMKSRRENWWLFGSAAKGMRKATKDLERFIATPRVSKHRIFSWTSHEYLPNDSLTVIARDDDFTFGVLQSTIHETWALALGTWLGKGNDPRYTPTTCFETFPFPTPTDKQREAIANEAVYLCETRDGIVAANKGLTLTNLYNTLNELREAPDLEHDFYPLLDAHNSLDAAVAEAYGWEWELDKETILERLLGLNLERINM